MMGDRLIGEAPGIYAGAVATLRSDLAACLDAPAFSHLQATLDALQIQPMKRSPRRLSTTSFANLMDDATAHAAV